MFVANDCRDQGGLEPVADQVLQVGEEVWSSLYVKKELT